MMKKKALLIGSSGYLATQLKQSLKNYTLFTASSSDPKADIFIEKDGTLIYRNKITSFDIALFCTALTKINLCEEKPKQAHWINCDLPIKVYSQLTQKYNFFPVIISSDAVFYCINNLHLYEETPPYPTSVYGKTKRALELYFIENIPSAIIRLPKLWGKSETDFVHDFKNQLHTNSRIGAYTDQFFRPLYIEDACYSIEQICLLEKKGIYHLPGPELLSWYEIALRIAAQMNIASNAVHSMQLSKTPSHRIRSQYSNLHSQHALCEGKKRKTLFL